MSSKSQKEIKDGLEFGLTDEEYRYQAAIAYRAAAMNDGWSCESTYDNEVMDRHSSHLKDGFHMTVMSRKNDEGRWAYQVDVSIWGPDGMVIKPPDVYDWNAIKAGVRTCNICGKTDVDTQRYSFAGRCCADCRSEMAKKHEYQGWNN